MVNSIDNGELKLFADDTISSSSAKCLQNVFEKMKRNIKKMQIWFNSNKLTLNLSKTCYSIFHSKYKSIPDQFDSMTFDNTIIKRTTCTEYLGLSIDEVLSWKRHVDKIISSLIKYFNIFYQLRNAVPSKMKLQLFHAYIYSRVCYGLHCYGFMHKSNMKKLQIICNKLLKILLKKDRLYPTNMLYKECKLLKVEDMHKFLILQFVHKSIYITMNTPESCKGYFTLNTNAHGINVRDNRLVKIPLVKTTMGATGVYWFGASLWNKLPYHIRNEHDIVKFKKNLKAHILSKY